jgi:hypothetical protein
LGRAKITQAKIYGEGIYEENQGIADFGEEMLNI